MKKVLVILLLFFICSCSKEEKEIKAPTLFNLRDNISIDFSNILNETEQLNPYTYRNFYNGGGVAVGDINNDGLLDIYFGGNLVDNKLYLNKGNWQFEDITTKAGVACTKVWTSGVSFVDINYDGLLDIYVCKAGPPSNEANRHNELFINNGDLTFTEKSKEYGLDLVGLSVQANFFDYDKDGDLDCYLLNNSIKTVGSFDYIENQRLQATETGNKLLRNDGDIFVDVTKESNIYSSAIGFGLGITVSDFNNDNWPDIFISNDFFERDYLYTNNQDGTFKENLVDKMGSISMGSMGADAADLDNDSNIDLMVTEMLPKTLERQRTKTIFESWNKHEMAVKKGYHNQFSRNALHRNMGENGFMEISRFSNVAATEWSWASLLFDADNDGLRDIFVSNGIYKDLLDRDYLTYMANEDKIRDMIKNDKQIMNKLVDLMPSEAVPNVMYKNLGQFQFEETTTQWGLDKPSFSNGSAYGDLDNDGDLDLIVNNVNMPSFVYENSLDTTYNKFIAVKLKGNAKNTFAIGAKVEIYYANTYGLLENYPSRGFQSSVDPTLTFGVKNANTIDSLIITWPDDTIEKHFKLKTNQRLEFQQGNGAQSISKNSNLLAKQDFIIPTEPLFDYKHMENNASDFNREQLLPEMFNNEGPCIAKADLNNDNIIDFYVGGAKGQAGILFISQPNKQYKQILEPFNFDAKSEDTDAVFFDSDGDGDLDLYVCSGGKSFSKYDYSLNDRLYINEGNNVFKSKVNSINFPSPISTSTVSVYDFDNDGDTDIFIGERFKVETYGLPVSGYILVNNGNNKFEFTQPSFLNELGLITDSTWNDIDGDGTKDLIICGEWMPISIFINKNGILNNETTKYGLQESTGFWKTILVADLDNDGDMDIVAGNKGDNSFFKDGTKMYVSDFDNNGTIEQIFCHKIGDNYYPIVDRDELISQIASLKKKFLFYKNYQNATIDSLFNKEVLDKAKILKINTVKTSLFINNGSVFKIEKLPSEIQYSNVDAITLVDLNHDGNEDLLFGGNQYLVKPQFGIQDASKGWVVFGDKLKKFTNVAALGINGQIRKLQVFNYSGCDYLLAGINNDSLKFFQIKAPQPTNSLKK